MFLVRGQGDVTLLSRCNARAGLAIPANDLRGDAKSRSGRALARRSL